VLTYPDPLFRLTASTGKIIKIYIGVFDVAWLENKGAYSLARQTALCKP
jgi:hypothetical protein